MSLAGRKKIWPRLCAQPRDSLYSLRAPARDSAQVCRFAGTGAVDVPPVLQLPEKSDRPGLDGDFGPHSRGTRRDFGRFISHILRRISAGSFRNKCFVGNIGQLLVRVSEDRGQLTKVSSMSLMEPSGAVSHSLMPSAFCDDETSAIVTSQTRVNGTLLELSGTTEELSS